MVMEEVVIFPPLALTCKGDLMVSKAIQFTRDPSTLSCTYTLSNITSPNLAILFTLFDWDILQDELGCLNATLRYDGYSQKRLC
jgi:hypothetical protein